MQVNLLASVEEGEEEERSLSGSLLFLVSHPYETTYAMKMHNVFIIICVHRLPSENAKKTCVMEFST